MPSGFVTASTSNRNTTICNHPFIVIQLSPVTVCFPQPPWTAHAAVDPAADSCGLPQLSAPPPPDQNGLHPSMANHQNLSGRSSAYTRYTVVNALTTSMIIDSVLISLSSLQAIAKLHVSNRQSEECDRDCDPKNVLHISPLELHHDGESHTGFVFSQIRTPTRSRD